MKRRDLFAIAAGAALGTALLPSDARAKVAAAPLARPNGKPVLAAFVMGPHATVIDWAGPWEAFMDVMASGTGTGFGFECAMVSDSVEPLTESGLTVVPNYTYDNFPAQPNVIVVGAQRDYTPAKLAWIRDAAKNADVVMSVCLGAFLVAQTGLFDGLQATTHHSAYDKFAKEFPKVQLVKGPRFVDNGKFASSGGESSGIDLAFHVVSRYYGEKGAAEAADIMEFTRATPRPR